MKFPAVFSMRKRWGKTREILICCRNCSQGSCSCFDFPLARSPKLRLRSQSRYSSKIEIPFLKRSEIPIAIVTSKSAIVCAPIFLPMKLALSYLELSKLFFAKDNLSTARVPNSCKMLYFLLDSVIFQKHLHFHALNQFQTELNKKTSP